MRAPLARPPGRRGWLRRLAPEWCALGVYLVLVAISGWFLWQVHGLPRRPFGVMEGALQAALAGAVWACALAGLILIFGPAVSGTLAWGRERDRDTMEPLVLTPADRGALVRGRFWRTALPWLRFCAYLLPVYLLLSANELFRAACQPGEKWVLQEICAFGSPLLFSLVPGVWDELFQGPNQPHLWAIVLGLLRWVNDATVPLFACALAYFLSLRCRTAGRALCWACLLVPVALFTALDLHDWLLLLAIWKIIDVSRPGVSYALVCSGYLALGLGAFVGRIWLALWLVRRAARNFDWYALGEKPPAQRA